MQDDQLSVLVAAGFPELSLTDQMDVVRWVGARGVQVWLNYSSPPDPGEVREVVSGAGLTITSVHGPFGPGCDLSSGESAERAEAVERMKEALELAGQLNAHYLVVHPASGREDPSQLPDRLQLVGQSLARLVPWAERHRVRLALENMPPGWPGARPDDLLIILHSLTSPTLGVCFDIGHANLVGRPVRQWRQLARHTIALHVHDNDGTADQHREPFAGRIDFAALRRALVEENYQGDFVLECLEQLVGMFRRGEENWRERFRRWWEGLGE